MADYKLDIIDETIRIISDEFLTLLQNDEKYKGVKITITNEQQFVKLKIVPNKIYIVVKFLQGNNDFGQQRQPISLTAISEHNGLAICQQLMMDYAATYNLNLMTADHYTLRQTITTASVISNFNEVYDGYRSVFYVSGTFYYGIESNPIEWIRVGDVTTEEETEEYISSLTKINFLSAHLAYDSQVDSQPFYGTNNFNRSVNKISTLSLGFTMYAVDNTFYNSIMSLVFNENNNVDINKTYRFYIKLKNKTTPYKVNMHLVNVSSTQEVRDFPAASFSFVK